MPGSKQPARGRASALGAYVALLRGINVGGKNPVPMKDLTAIFERARCGEVRTYIQSGNVVFRATSRVIERLPQAFARAMSDRFGYSVPVVLRSSAELAAVERHNPFLEAGVDPRTLLVLFLTERPRPAGLGALDPHRSPPDEFCVRGREIYLRCPNGFGRSKLTNDYFDAKLGTTSTGRNWQTVLKLIEMTKQ